MVPGSTLIYGSSLTIATFSPRASRIAPKDAAAMPLPNEDTTPPVTNTKRVIFFKSRVPVATDLSATKGERRRASRLAHLPAPNEAGAAPARRTCLHGLVKPAICHRDEPPAGVNQRHPCALLERHAGLLQETLEDAAGAATHRPQPLAAAARPHDEGRGQRIQVQRPARVILQRQGPCTAGERAVPLAAPLPVERAFARRDGGRGTRWRRRGARAQGEQIPLPLNDRPLPGDLRV